MAQITETQIELKQKVDPNLSKFLNEISKISDNRGKQVLMTPEAQLDRLTTERFVNPYDVLLLNAEAPDEEIRKQYRAISIIVHPDKCKDPRAYDAFHIVEQAYKTLMDLEKRKVYQRIMREAWDRTTYERAREDKKRAKQGLPPLPTDQFDQQYKDLCQKLFDEIEEKKEHYKRLDEATKYRRREEVETRRFREQYKQVTDEEWESTRESRVGDWRNFSSKKHIIGTKSSSRMIKPPAVKLEQRPDESKKDLSNKPMGINDDYKRAWK